MHVELCNAGFHKKGGYYQCGRGRPIHGNTLKCNICESILHFAKDCPHSYANLNKSESVSQKVSVLFTGQKKEEISMLLSESIHSAILDSVSSSTVVGEQWITCYLDLLTHDELAEVKREPSDTVFKFGGGEQIKSSEKITQPCWLAGVKFSSFLRWFKDDLSFNFISL